VQRFLGELAVGHLLFQFDGAFIYTPFQVVARAA